MPFAKIMRDSLTLVKQDGSKTEGIKGNVQKNIIYIHRHDIMIETGDELIRTMPGGRDEGYVVIQPNFREGLGSIPAGYQAEVERKSLFASSVKSIETHPTSVSAPVTNNYHFHGDNGRVNNNSVDNSHNYKGGSEDISHVLNTILAAHDEGAANEVPAHANHTEATKLMIVQDKLNSLSLQRRLQKLCMAFFHKH